MRRFRLIQDATAIAFTPHRPAVCCVDRPRDKKEVRTADELRSERQVDTGHTGKHRSPWRKPTFQSGVALSSGPQLVHDENQAGNCTDGQEHRRPRATVDRTDRGTSAPTTPTDATGAATEVVSEYRSAKPTARSVDGTDPPLTAVHPARWSHSRLGVELVAVAGRAVGE